MVVVALTLASCSLNTDYFSDYNNVNLLSNWDFTSSTAGTPNWALTSDTITTDSTYNPNPTDYMNWTDLGAGTGPTTNSHAYRLEIKNLIPNGDFSAPLSSWSISGTGTATEVSSAVAQNNTSVTLGVPALNWKSSLSTDTLSLNLNSALGNSSISSQPLWRSGQYNLQMTFIDLFTSTPCQLNFVPTTGITTTWTYPNSGLSNTNYPIQHLNALNSPGASVSNLVSYSGANDALVFTTTNNTQNILFSGLQLVRSDLPLSVSTSLPSLTSGTLQLIPGTYQFIVWVKDDSTAGTANRFAATGLTIKITAATQPGNNGTFEAFFPDTGWSSWTQLTLPLGTVDFVDYDSQHTGSPALTIALSPTNTYNDSPSLAAGSLWVASPTLQFLH